MEAGVVEGNSTLAGILGRLHGSLYFEVEKKWMMVWLRMEAKGVEMTEEGL